MIINRIIFYAVKAYQCLLAPQRIIPRCKYHPSCSEYTILAVEKHGSFLGLAKSLWRVVRCNPFSRGGIDMP